MSKSAVLLLNLGTPAAATVPAIRQFLREFLSDPRVIDIHALARWPLVNLLLAPFRPYKLLHQYQAIWHEQQPPLLYYSKQLQQALRAYAAEGYDILLAMRYGEPSIDRAITALQQAQYDKVLILPLFPQYSSACTGSALQEVLQQLAKLRHIPSIEVVHAFYDEPFYIQSYSQVLREQLQGIAYDQIIFSFHGLPLSQAQKSDATPFCYRSQVYATAHTIAAQLNLAAASYTIAFQSRLGAKAWLAPYLDDCLAALAQRGCKNIVITSPSFVCDCLETLEELNIRARATWQRLTGNTGQLLVTTCLNANSIWTRQLSHWLSTKLTAAPLHDNNAA